MSPFPPTRPSVPVEKLLAENGPRVRLTGVGPPRRLSGTINQPRIAAVVSQSEEACQHDLRR